MKISFGVGIGAVLLRREDTQQFMDLVRMADGYGIEAIGTYDSAFIGGDTYVRTTLMALASEHARIGPRPTNPLTREPQVMASFLASIDSLTNGRAFMDIASGDSAVFNMGFTAASRARLEDYVTCVRDLLARGEAAYQDRPQRVRWTAEAVRQRIPISICAEGPKMLHLGGRIGDGVIAGTGLTPESFKTPWPVSTLGPERPAAPQKTWISGSPPAPHSTKTVSRRSTTSRRPCPRYSTMPCVSDWTASWCPTSYASVSRPMWMGMCCTIMSLERARTPGVWTHWG